MDRDVTGCFEALELCVGPVDRSGGGFDALAIAVGAGVIAVLAVGAGSRVS